MINSNPDKIKEAEAKEYLRHFLGSINKNVDDNDINLLVNAFSIEKHKKNSKVIDEGEIAEYFYYIFRGVIQVYYFKNNKKVIDRFEKEGAFFGGNFSHITKQPGTHIYETIEDCIFLKLKFSELERLSNDNHGIERMYRVGMENFHLSYAKNVFAFKSLTSEEKYTEFKKQYGEIANRISLKNIANFLDMTSETLSRIRSKYDKS